MPEDLAEDYKEAGIVLADSPKASAALNRRCLQNLLRTHIKVKEGDLHSEIQELLNRKELPSIIADQVDYVRVIGNFAAHPMKNTTTGQIESVEPGEAEWNLNTLESLFDIYFVMPKKLAGKEENA